MQLTRALFQNSIALFVVFFVLTLWAFWSTYYSSPLGLTAALQLHGVTMTLWCMMLISQAYLIRAGRRDLHRVIGKSSFVLAPLVVIFMSIVILGRAWTEGVVGPDGVLPKGLSRVIPIFIPLLFGGAYGMAILNRHNPAVHARWMVCTLPPLLGPVTDRIVAFSFPGLIQYFPIRPGFDRPYISLLAFAIGDLVLAGLAVWDWRSHKRLSVFPVMLAVMLIHQVLTWNAARIPVLEKMVNWLLGIG